MGEKASSINNNNGLIIIRTLFIKSLLTSIEVTY